MVARDPRVDRGRSRHRVFRLRALVLLAGASVSLAAQSAPSGPVPADPAPTVVQAQIVAPDYRLEFLPQVHLAGQGRLLLALGGGAAKGIAHAGVLQRLQEEGITVDGIAGTSMGAFIGSMAAAGYSGRALEDLLKDVDLGALLLDRQHRFPGETLWEQEHENATFLSVEYRPGAGFAFTPGASPGLELKRALEILLSRTQLHAHHGFDGLRMPFRAVSTDLQTGRADAPPQGDLASVVRASMSIPGMFRPVLRDGHQHVDGMLVQNLPVETARSLEPGAIVVAVEVGETLEALQQHSIFGIARRSLDVSIEERTAVSRRAADLLIRPDTAAIPHLDFHSQVAVAVARGREAFEARRQELESLLYGPAARQSAPATLRVEAPEPLRGRLEALGLASLPEGPRRRGDYLRLLRLASGLGQVRSGELQFGSEAVVLVAEPYADVRQVRIQAPGPWTARLEGLLREAGVRPGDPFNPYALGQALDRFFYRLTIEGRPLVSAEGTGFDPASGTLQVKVTEVVPRTVRVAEGILPQAETAYLDRVFRKFQGQPCEIWPFARQQLLAEKRLGLEELQPGLDPAAPGDGVLLTPVPDRRTIIDAAFAYETTWQAQTALQVRTHRLLGTGLGLRLDASADKVWQFLGVVLARPLAFWPRLAGEVSLRQEEHHFQQPFLALPARRLPAGLPSRSLRERSLGLGLSARVGLEDRGLLELEASRRHAELQPGEQTEGLPRMDQLELRFELDEFDRYLFPTTGTLVRLRYGCGRLAEAEGGGSRTYRFGYGRLRHLLPFGNWGSLEGDLEAGTSSHAPLPRWHPVGGPAFLAGSPSIGQPLANFAMGRLGLPVRVLGDFGINMQLAPRLDVGYLGADDPGHLRRGAWVRGIGLGLRSELGRWYWEVSGGRWSGTAGSAERLRCNVLLGAHPFDLWHPHP